MSVIQEICDRVAIIDGGLIAEEGGVEEIFRAPKTKIGQELVMHEGTNREAYTGKLPYSYRLVFKGGSENEPVLGQMMIELKNVVNIWRQIQERLKIKPLVRCWCSSPRKRKFARK